ncbi:hypothetical protein DFQ28_008222 [Apophysomyces sp. BC1034]|nr:hypothetical protein DFQ30_007917 [Apophysomyces sp. BC1015]KAG0174686.1 hypothetical protein DFQ29_007410 [Apophysomyces sp. BC1021]KAG0186182.1 hypothetical protein DFQ28_008222 [Apophysomyces sp. BC1034]
MTRPLPRPAQRLPLAMLRSKQGTFIRSRDVIYSLFIVFFVLVALVPSAKAWEQADFEIFDLVDELEKSEGKGVTFYSWMKLTPTSSASEISRAYRKLSLQLHPDKNVGDIHAKEKFARLGKIAAILRNSGSRERYNFFYKNGVPRWRGTGYYYARFRPGLGTVLGFLVLLTATMQYLAKYINYRLEKKKILHFVEDARAALAYKVPKGHGAPTLGRSYIDVGRRTLACEVKSDTYLIVYPEGNEEPVHLNVDWVQKPKVTDVYVIQWPMSLVRKVFGIKPAEPKIKEEDEPEEEEEVEEVEEENQSKKIKKKKKKTELLSVTGTKVGGRRRAVKK